MDGNILSTLYNVSLDNIYIIFVHTLKTFL
jgi:hypothetical protein